MRSNQENVESGISIICDEMVDERTLEVAKESLSEQKLEENLIF